MTGDEPHRHVETDALHDGVEADIGYMRNHRGIWVSRDDVVTFLVLAGCLQAADLIRECGREWDR